MSEQTTLSEYLRRNAIEKRASPFAQRKDYRLWESTASQGETQIVVTNGFSESMGLSMGFSLRGLENLASVDVDGSFSTWRF